MGIGRSMDTKLTDSRHVRPHFEPRRPVFGTRPTTSMGVSYVGDVHVRCVDVACLIQQSAVVRGGPWKWAAAGFKPIRTRDRHWDPADGSQLVVSPVTYHLPYCVQVRAFARIPTQTPRVPIPQTAKRAPWEGCRGRRRAFMASAHTHTHDTV
jgi:hypothetical protein